jgi:hypothetical protein
MKQHSLKSLCVGITLIGLVAASGETKAGVLDSAVVCQDGLNYSWDAVSGAGYRVCPIRSDQVSYSSIEGNMYISNPSSATVSGYFNTIMWDGTWTGWCSMSTTARHLGCSVDTHGYFVFATYDHDVPSGVTVYGFYTTATP